MYKLVYEQSGNDYNSAPAGWREITEKEFAQSHFFTYSPASMEYRQIRDLPDGTRLTSLLACTMFNMHDGTGYAMEHKLWDGKVKYYKYGCDHDYKELGVSESAEHGIQHYGQHCHVYLCKKCNHLKQEDSSG